MASKIVYLEVLDDKALDDMFAFIGNLIRNKYNNHKLDTTIGFAISARGVQKIEFVARRTDFKEIEDGSPEVPRLDMHKDITSLPDDKSGNNTGNVNEEQVSNDKGVDSQRTESTSSSDADPGDSQPDSDSGC